MLIRAFYHRFDRVDFLLLVIHNIRKVLENLIGAHVEERSKCKVTLRNV